MQADALALMRASMSCCMIKRSLDQVWHFSIYTLLLLVLQRRMQEIVNIIHACVRNIKGLLYDSFTSDLTPKRERNRMKTIQVWRKAQVMSKEEDTTVLRFWRSLTNCVCFVQQRMGNAGRCSLTIWFARWVLVSLAAAPMYKWARNCQHHFWADCIDFFTLDIPNNDWLS